MTSTSSWATALWPHASSGWTARGTPLFQLHQPPDARPRLLQPDGRHLYPGQQRERPHESLRGRVVARMGRRPQDGRCAYFHQWKKESLSGSRRICYHPAGGSGQRGGPAQEQAGAHPMGSSGRAPCRGLLPHAPGHYGTGIRKPRQAAGKKRTDPAPRRRPAASGYGRRNSG